MPYKKEGYIIHISKRKGKKYDVYKGDKYIVSFGAYPMQQYHDKLGHYRYLDHHDKTRLKAFRSRFKKNIENADPSKGIYWSAKYLWT